MDKAYNLDGVLTILRKELDIALCLKKAWENVEIVTKKDGTPFKIMSKNFKGATYKSTEYSLQPHENILQICTWTTTSGYITDKIDCYCLVKYLKDNDPRKAKTENYMPKQQYLEQIYKFDLEDIKQAINKRIEYLTIRAKELEEQIANAQKVYNKFVEAYGKAMRELSDDCAKWTNKDLYYAVRDTVKDRYPYC